MQEPRSGLFQWLVWGPADPPTSGFGVVSGGDLSANPQGRRRVGIGGNEHRRGGLNEYQGSATFNVSESNQELIGKGLRATYPRGALDPLYIAGGADDFDRYYQRAYLTEVSLEYSQNEALRATVAWGALDWADDFPGSKVMPAEDKDDFEDYEFICLFEGQEYHVQAFSLRWTNNFGFHGSGNTKVGLKRDPQFVIYGYEDLSFGLTTAEPIPLTTTSFYADCPPDNLGSILTGTNCDGKVLTLTLSRLMMNAPEVFGLKGPNDLIDYGYGFFGSAALGSLNWGWA